MADSAGPALRRRARVMQRPAAPAAYAAAPAADQLAAPAGELQQQPAAPAAELQQQPAAPAAVSCIDDCVERLWGRLTTRQRVNVRFRPRKLKVGTACSGTDSVMKVLARLQVATGWEFEHTFSCEFSETKRRWLTDNFPGVQHIFVDVTELHKGIALDAVSGRPVPVPPVDLFIAGFVCKSVSAENAQRAEFADCIARSSGLTGETFRGVQLFCQEFQPSIVICENVSGLVKRIGGSEPPIEAVEREFAAMGYSVGHEVLDSRHFLLPQRRTRCWIWAMRRVVAGSERCVLDVLSQLQQPTPTPLSEFLASAAAGPTDWFFFSGRAKLSEREMRVVEHARSHVARARPLQRLLDLVVDVSKSFGRAPSCVDASTCVLPNSRLYWQRENRVQG